MTLPLPVDTIWCFNAWIPKAWLDKWIGLRGVKIEGALCRPNNVLDPLTTSNNKWKDSYLGPGFDTYLKCIFYFNTCRCIWGLIWKYALGKSLKNASNGHFKMHIFNSCQGDAKCVWQTTERGEKEEMTVHVPTLTYMAPPVNWTRPLPQHSHFNNHHHGSGNFWRKKNMSRFKANTSKEIYGPALNQICETKGMQKSHWDQMDAGTEITMKVLGATLTYTGVKWL